MSCRGCILFFLLLSLVQTGGFSEKSVIVTAAECIPGGVPGVPVLLVEKDSIPESTAYFLEDFSPGNVYVLGEVDPSVTENLSQYGKVITITPDELSKMKGEDLTIPHYVVVSDPEDPFYPAAKLLASYRGAPVIPVPQDLKAVLQKEWKFMQWEFIGSMWGMWEYALWDQTEDKLQWIGYRYLFTDSLFETHSFRERMVDTAYTFLPENTGYVAVVGEIGTSMEYWREELSENHILIPTPTSTCDPQDYTHFRCDYAPYHKKYVSFTSVERFNPVEELNDVLFQDAPKYWVSSEKEREDLIKMASPYIEVMPAPEVPLTLDYLLAEKVAVGRFTGYDLADTVAFIARALFLPPQSENACIANNIEVPVYTHALLHLFEETETPTVYYPLGEAEVHVLEHLQNTSVFVYNGTGNCSFFLPHFYKKGEGVATSLDMEVEEGMEPSMFIFSPGNGCISFWFPDITNLYDMTISEGFSQEIWDFTAARPELFVLVSDLKGEHIGLAESEIDAIVREKIPSLNHFNSPFLYVFAAGPIGSSEFPLWLIQKGASGFVINVGMQEVLTNFEFEVLFFSAALAGNPVGEAMLYAKNAVHTAGYWYPLSGLWMSEEQYVREEACCLFGDPAFTIPVERPLDSVPSLDELLSDPSKEAQNLLEKIQNIKERLSELEIEVEGIDEALTESQKVIDEKDPESALEFIKNEYKKIKDELHQICQGEIEKSEKIAENDLELLGILASAKKAFDEERYVDCLVLTSQISEKGKSSRTVLFMGIGAVIAGVVLVVCFVYFRR
ncbi:MAG: hypothetical protein AYK19_09600 [Theionarchaea archaeon DG-70-1]|nr:MAG: hypothetical protein AYK19_09600 [Theionarchaea archaeon DG-70-1]